MLVCLLAYILMCIPAYIKRAYNASRQNVCMPMCMVPPGEEVALSVTDPPKDQIWRGGGPYTLKLFFFINSLPYSERFKGTVQRNLRWV
jgi:hypothetical protein